MKGKIIGIGYKDYPDKKNEGKRVKGVSIFYTVGSMEVFGLVGKEEFIKEETPTYKKYEKMFLSCDDVIGHELEIEFQVEKYGQTTVAKLCKFEIGEKLADVA